MNTMRSPIILVLAILPAAISISVIIGWYGDFDILKSVIPGFTSMKYNTALCLLFSSSSLLIWLKSKKTLFFYGLATISLLLAFFTHLQVYFSIDFGIDHFFMNDSAHEVFPGRMAQTTSFCIILLNGGLLLFYWNQFRIAQYLFHLVTLIATIAFLGYFLDMEQLHKFSSFTSMALHTSITLILLSLAASMLNPHVGITSLFYGEGMGDRMARKIFLSMLLAIIILGWLRLEANRKDWIGIEFGIAIFALSFIFIGLVMIGSSAQWLNGIAHDLVKSNEQLHNFQNAILQSSIVCRANYQGIITDVNENYSKLTGYSREEVIGSPLSFHNVEENKESRWEATREKIVKSNNWHAEIKSKKKDGTDYWLDTFILPFTDKDGRITEFVSICHDITDRKEIEMRSQELKESLLQSQHIASVGSWEMTEDTEENFWSDEFYRIHGLDPGSVRPTTALRLKMVHPDDREKLALAIAEAFVRNQPYSIEKRIMRPNGEVRWILSQGEVNVESTTGKRKVFGTILDITERKNAQLETQKKNNQLESVLSGITDGFFAVDKDLAFTVVGDRFAQMAQRDKKEMIGKKMLELFPFMEGGDLFNRYKQALITHQSDSFEYTSVHSPGVYFNIDIYPNPEGLFIFFRDITEARNAKLEILKLNKSLQEINQQLELKVNERTFDLLQANTHLEYLTDQLNKNNEKLKSYIHILSHNLRSYAVNLSYFVKYLGEDNDVQMQEELLARMSSLVVNFNQTMDTLIEVVKTQDTRDQKRDSISLADTLMATQAVLSVNLEASGAFIETDFDELPIVEYPKVYLDSIFLNLISNSIKYRSPSRQPVIRIKSYQVEHAHYLSFSDNGLGIDTEKNKTKLFGLNKTFHRHPEARGVGLFIIKTQIESLGGSIEIESGVDRGTTFTIKLY